MKSLLQKTLQQQLNAHIAKFHYNYANITLFKYFHQNLETLESCYSYSFRVKIKNFYFSLIIILHEKIKKSKKFGNCKKIWTTNLNNPELVLA